MCTQFNMDGDQNSSRMCMCIEFVIEVHDKIIGVHILLLGWQQCQTTRTLPVGHRMLFLPAEFLFNFSENSWPPFASLRSQANDSLTLSSFTLFFPSNKARFVRSHIHLEITGE